MKQEIDLHVIRSCTARLYFIDKILLFYTWEKSLFNKLDLIGLAFRYKTIAVIKDLNSNETIVDPKDPNDYKLYKKK